MDGVAGHAQRLGDLPNAVPLTDPYPYIHCLLRAQMSGLDKASTLAQVGQFTSALTFIGIHTER